ncbi:MAG: MFS transporter [Erythrobacter sp.]|nr:MFS transporter [Erythrobacter sp.]
MTGDTAQTDAVPSAALSEGKRTAAFFTVLIAVVLEVVDSTIVNTALPVIRQSLDASPAEMQWIVAGYLLLLGSLLLLGGRLGDALGHSRMFLAGVAAFVVASVLCGLARNPEELIAARMLQGAAGAIMAPQSMAVVQLLYSPLERVKQLAYFGLVLGLAAILGPILGGALIDLDVLGLGWPVIFLINLPIGLLALVLGWFVLPTAEDKAELRVDPLGALVFSLGLGGVLYALIEGNEKGWTLNLGALLVLAVALLAWGWWRARRREAAHLPTIIRPTLFAIPTFCWATTASFAFAAASIGFLLVFAVALQSGLGLSPLDTALVHIPFGIGVMVAVGVFVPRLLPRLGKLVPLAGGLLMLAGAVASMLLIAGGDGGNAPLLVILAFTGVGMGLLNGPLGPIVVADVSREHAGTASATFRTAQQIGGAAGIALVGGAYFARAAATGTPLAGMLPAAVVVAVLLAVTVACVWMLPRRLFAGDAD